MYDYLVTAIPTTGTAYGRMVREQSPQLAAEKWAKEAELTPKDAEQFQMLVVTEVVPSESPVHTIACRATHSFQFFARLDVAPMEMPF